jgi:hypothetical protein
MQLIINVDDDGNLIVIFPEGKQLTYDHDTYFGEAVHEVIEESGRYDWSSD